jgi:hypothetical protein
MTQEEFTKSVDVRINEILDHLSTHDCHAGEEDGCLTCYQYGFTDETNI